MTPSATTTIAFGTLVAAVLIAGPATAQNNQCSMMCNGTGNACYSACAGPNYAPRAGGAFAPGSGASRSGGGYGAIAVSERVGDSLSWGKAYGYGSSEAAKAAAIRYCTSAGGPDCKARVWFSNACAALVTTPDATWWAVWRPSLAVARREALERCTEADKGRCTVKEAFCSS
jgi:hypothetical protein